MRGWTTRWRQELRTAVRRLVRHPGHAAVVVLTLALGIGANAAVFGVVDAVLLEPLPYDDPDRLVAVLQNLRDEEDRGQAPADIDFMRDRLDVLERIMWFREPEAMTLTGLGDPEQLQGRRVSATFFDVLGVSAARGRILRPGEDRPGSDDIVVLSHGYWQSRFAGEAGTVGRTVRISDRPRTVVGILPPDFRFEIDGHQDVFVPRVFDPESGNYTGWFSDGMVARLRPGASLADASAEVERMSDVLTAEFPTRRTGVRMRVEPLSTHLSADATSLLLMLLGAVGLVLVIGCANLAHLTLARLSDRRRDLSLHVALGAERHALVVSQVVEAGVLAVAGLAAGMIVGTVALGAFVSLGPGDVPGLAAAQIDLRVFGLAAALGVGATIAFGALPALVITRDLRGSFGSGRGAAKSVSAAPRGLLIGAESAIVSGLLLLSGLLTVSVINILGTDPGFDTDARTAVQLTLPPDRYPTAPEIQAFFTEAIERMAAIPGVRDVGAISTLPLSGEGITIPAPVAEGEELTGPAVATRPRSGWDAVSRGFFRAAGIPVVAGRAFDRTEHADDSTKALVVNRAFADAVFGSNDPVGARVGFGTPPSRWMRVVGVVGNIRHDDLRETPRMAMYQLAEQVTFAWPTMEIVLRHEAGTSVSGPALRSAVWSVDPDQPVVRVRSLDSVRQGSASTERYQAVLTGAFAMLALLLGSLGIYGVVRFVTARRAQEFGVRLALGASGRAIRSMVVRSTLLWIGAGVSVGLAGGMATAWSVRAHLHAISPFDPGIAGAVALLVGLVGVAAAYGPARGASRTDPIDVLRDG